MNTKSLKDKIKKVRSELSWPVIEKSHDVPAVYIATSFQHRKHAIMLPPKGKNQSTDLDYLHELGRARLCEQVHPVFGTGHQFVRQTENRNFLVMRPALDAASDWFIDHWLLGVAPRATRRQFREGLAMAEEVIADPKLPSLEILLDASLVIAQSIRYLKEPIECDGPLKQAVEAFLSVSPDEPSLANCITLMNRLQATYTDQRAELAPDGAGYVWQFSRETDTAPAKG